MKRKDAPELYEVLKRGNVDITKPGDKEETVPVIKEEKVAEMKPLPLAAKPAEVTAFPRLKSSFTKKSGGSLGEKKLNLSYNGLIFLILLVIVLLAAAFAVGFQLGGKQTTSAGTAGTGTVQKPPEHPPVVATTWNIRVDYYDNAARAEKAKKRLMDKGVTNITQTTETDQGQTRVVLNLGPYPTESAANNALKSLKTKLHDSTFNNSKVIPVK